MTQVGTLEAAKRAGWSTQHFRAVMKLWRVTPCGWTGTRQTEFAWDKAQVEQAIRAHHAQRRAIKAERLRINIALASPKRLSAGRALARLRQIEAYRQKVLARIAARASAA